MGYGRVPWQPRLALLLGKARQFLRRQYPAFHPRLKSSREIDGNDVQFVQRI